MKQTPPGTIDSVLIEASAPPLSDAPSRLSDYFRLTKPRMNVLIVSTTLVGVYVAAKVLSVSSSTALFTWANALIAVHTIFGTAMTAASASVFNQIIERDLDRRMRRTRNRPLAAGRLGVLESTLFAATLGIAGVVWLALGVNLLTALLGLATLALYTLVYTPLKRVSPWCTLVGAVPGAIPPMMGVTAIDGSLSPLAWTLFAILMVWQMPHFFALAIMYKDDYAAGGFRMLPSCKNGDARARKEIILYSLLLVPVTFLPVFFSGASYLYGVSAMLLGVWFLIRAFACRVPIDGKLNERKLFICSIIYLPLLLTALMVDQ